jgi:predicted Ser/Thr protein kinase
MPEHSDTPPPTPADEQKQPVKLFGDYEIEGELGRGGMGVVYLARQVELNRHVALKTLTGRYGPDELQRFLEEAETAAALNHPNIAHIYEVGEHEGAPFFSMEYVNSGSLADRLRKELPSPQEAAQLLMSVARALHFAHQNGVVHRDMKPANVLLDPDSLPKITDFGIAKRLKDDSKLTRTGAVIGTPSYMAPEQAKGDSRNAGPAADIYSLGAILYEMLTGRPPFLPEDSATPVTVRVLTEDPVSPAWHRPGIPRDLETICMKCLEKEPRERYGSAAALAEDLRRFLDDEPILAKPPSTIVKGVKWVRRNPWKVIAASVALLAVAAGVARLVQWMLYQRAQVEYAAQVVWVNGVLEPVEKLSEGDASRRAYYLRLTRRGRRGPVAKVEVLNARGYPAELRRIESPEMIQLYGEGLAGTMPYAQRLAETTTVEFTYDDDGSVREATGRERNGQVTWRTIYERQVPDGPPGGTQGARFVNLTGLETNVPSNMVLERDPRGFDVKISFSNAAGWAVPNGEGVYGYRLERDDAGRITQVVNLGDNGQPAPNSVGVTTYSFSYGQTLRSEFRDAKGQPVILSGVASVTVELDGAGNQTRKTNVGPDGKPARDAALPWSVQEMKRDERGELTERILFKADAGGALKQIRQDTISYDDYGHPAGITYTGDGASRIAWGRDGNGNITEEKVFNAKGELFTNSQGYAIKRLSYTSGAQGLRIEESYFDAAGEKTYGSAGFHRTIKEYDPAGPLRRLTQDEHDPSKYPYYRFVTELEFTPQWRLRYDRSSYEDAQGKLVTSGVFYPVTERFYDESGNVKTEWRTVGDQKEAGGPALCIETEWYPDGKAKQPVMKQQVTQTCDENHQPLPFISNGNAARQEVDFDVSGKLERIYEIGFDEKLVGFSSREAKFSGGSLQSVTRMRADGTEVNSVSVLVIAVIPPPQQPKSAELKEGDQILAANGKPVTSAYALLFSGGGFPGGSIEVSRGGQRIRIEGFSPGPLGLFLQERAAEGSHGRATPAELSRALNAKTPASAR